MCTQIDRPLGRKLRSLPGIPRRFYLWARQPHPRLAVFRRHDGGSALCHRALRSHRLRAARCAGNSGRLFGLGRGDSAAVHCLADLGAQKSAVPYCPEAQPARFPGGNFPHGLLCAFVRRLPVSFHSDCGLPRNVPVPSVVLSRHAADPERPRLHDALSDAGGAFFCALAARHLSVYHQGAHACQLGCAGGNGSAHKSLLDLRQPQHHGRLHGHVRSDDGSARLLRGKAEI